MKLRLVSNELINAFISLNNKEATMKYLGFGDAWSDVEEYASTFPVAHDEETGIELGIEDFNTMTIDELITSQDRDNSISVTGFAKEATKWHDNFSGERELGKAELCDWSDDGELTVYEPDFDEQLKLTGLLFFTKEEYVQLQKAQRALNLANYLAKVENAKTNADLSKIAFELLGGDKIIKLPDGTKKTIHVVGFCSKENPRGLYFFSSGGLTLFWNAYRAKKEAIKEKAKAAAADIEEVFTEYVYSIASAKMVGELRRLNQQIYADQRLPWIKKNKLWAASKERIAKMA